MEHRQTDESPGLIAGLAGIAKNSFGLLVSRIELAALELGEIRTNVARLMLVSALGVVAVWFAVAFWTGLVVVLAWDSWGWKILLLIAALFTAAAVGIFLYAKSMVDRNKLSMAATLNELRNDRDALL
ncbi:MAG: hypothetical protein V7606_853 [Burkholderiales bacterium]|jgi:uncharacterized membrane protein YqjE|nr:phage holin family protein [Burkholderia sp.]